jgi:probable phosphoglycerate mutase
MTTLESDKTQVVSVYIVRHGETEENKLGIIQGQLDTQLNAIGWDQAEKTGESLKDIRFRIAHSSDLDRAMKVCRTGVTLQDTNSEIGKTAKIILGHHPGVPLFGHTALRERVSYIVNQIMPHLLTCCGAYRTWASYRG